MKQLGYPSATWATNNPIIPERVLAIETDTNKLKVGDGETAWNDLPYLAGSGSGDVEEAPEDGKQYARKNAAWVEVAGGEGGLRTFLDGTSLYMTDDGSNPDPNAEPDSGLSIVMGTYSGYIGYMPEDVNTDTPAVGSLDGDLPEGITSIDRFIGMEGYGYMLAVTVSEELADYKEIKFKFGEIEVILYSSGNNQIETEFVTHTGEFFQSGDIVPFSYEVLGESPYPRSGDLVSHTFNVLVHQNLHPNGSSGSLDILNENLDPNDKPTNGEVDSTYGMLFEAYVRFRYDDDAISTGEPDGFDPASTGWVGINIHGRSSFSSATLSFGGKTFDVSSWMTYDQLSNSEMHSFINQFTDDQTVQVTVSAVW